MLESLASRLPVSRDAIERGLRRARVTGRFQVVHDRVDWILDVAHNPAAAQALAGQLAEQPRVGRRIAICGILADKDIDGIADALAASFDGWIVAGLEGERAMAAGLLAQRLARTGINVIATSGSVAEACQEAERAAQPGDTLVIFGSFLTVAPGLRWLRERGILRD